MKFIFGIILLLTIFLLFFPKCESLKKRNAKGMFVEFIIREDTRYSVDFDEREFKKIKIGMTKSIVLKLLGRPLEIFKPYKHNIKSNKKDYLSYMYTLSPTGKNYELRQVIFNDTTVVEIESYFYID